MSTRGRQEVLCYGSCSGVGNPGPDAVNRLDEASFACQNPSRRPTSCQLWGSVAGSGSLICRLPCPGPANE